MDNRAIGFMDSGVGGLTVMKEVQKELPNENMIYFGDELRLPYGEKTIEEIQSYSLQIAKFFLKNNVKLMVIACNTATARSLDMLQGLLPIPVIGVIKPGSKLAVNSTKNKKIGVIATSSTINSNSYKNTINKIDKEIHVYSLACPEFVTMVENENYNDFEHQDKVKSILKPIINYNIDTLVLGCTHFPIMKTLIQNAMGKHVLLVDPGLAVTQSVEDVLKDNRIKNDSNKKGITKFFTTGNASSFRRIAEDWLDYSVNVSSISINQLEDL
ncbi:glutamate racemase [Apilactobacillus sp. TMW 2.2459]|uniref:Glutamate racemase n=1 Tax=Apilactobacillus xinyiensis TaxID=2841032 RepID=A0ABT0I1R8_9LACO|nr:glutamate racemase [Apilactobacillus xinyiensis]MCK8624663.1 glutamate racemase [Apilactobacillus xinyiensis]MCL0312331.1 glutamate racemase [Apilactobacillus xinyiensis]